MKADAQAIWELYTEHRQKQANENELLQEGMPKWVKNVGFGAAALGAGAVATNMNKSEVQQSSTPAAIVQNVSPTASAHVTSETPSTASMEKPIKSNVRLSISNEKTILKTFQNVKNTSAPIPLGAYKYDVVRELGDLYPVQMVRVYDIQGNKVVALRFSKDNSEITNITKYGNRKLPSELRDYFKSQFNVIL
jgi:hypothetical protein